MDKARIPVKLHRRVALVLTEDAVLAEELLARKKLAQEIVGRLSGRALLVRPGRIDAVVEELHHPRTTAAVRTWLAHTPSWLEVEQVDEPVDPQLARLDPGERQAIQLAKRAHADLLLMDERLGVRIARAQGLAVTGTLGTLLQAARRWPRRGARR